MKKGEILEGTIERVDFPNKGIVRTDEGCVIVKNAMPGQKVRFQINKKRKNKAEGRLLEVTAPSPLETRAPVCSCFPACGGCMYQTMSYPAQLAMKEAQVRALLDAALTAGGQTDVDGHADYLFEGIKGSPQEFAYRNKMEFSFGDEYKDGPLSLGLHKKGSTYDVLHTSDCRLVHEDMTRILNCVLEFCREHHLPHYHKMRHIGYLRHLLLRRGQMTGEILVNIVTAGDAGLLTGTESGETALQTTVAQQTEADCQTAAAYQTEDSSSAVAAVWSNETRNRDSFSLDWTPLVERLLALPLSGRIVGILHIVNDSLSDVVRSDDTRLLWGQDHFYEELLGLKFKITPFSFFQPNSRAAALLYETVREYIGDTGSQTVFDLYSGTGTISQILAAASKEVIGVEIVEEAVRAAEANTQLNNIPNCRFIAGDVLKVLDEIPVRPDCIVLDPPRDGIHPKALPKILAYGVDRIVYISCKPTSLARDLESFLAHGYRVVRACCVDQFCQTVHVETIALLQKIN